MFQEGKHKLIFAISVAEVGIDIPACNIVVDDYEYAINEIGRIQRRGKDILQFTRPLMPRSGGSIPHVAEIIFSHIYSQQ